MRDQGRFLSPLVADLEMVHLVMYFNSVLSVHSVVKFCTEYSLQRLIRLPWMERRVPLSERCTGFFTTEDTEGTEKRIYVIKIQSYFCYK